MTARAGSAPLERAQVQRRTLTVVVLGQVLGGAGLAAGVTVGALLAQQMLGTEGLAGVPTALFTLGSALAAYLVGRVSQRLGRRVGLGLGFGSGGLGAVGVVVAAAADSVPLLFVSLFVYGAGTATNLQARYAGTDLATPATRGTAISIALVSTTFGAVAGPNLVGPLGRLAVGLGLPALSGPFLLAAVAYGAAGAVLFALLRPDPLLLARRLRESLTATVLALVLLGLGWNLGLISGTALVVDATEPANRPRTQGSIDVLVALAGAGGGVLSGVLVAASSYSTLSLAAGLLALALVPVLGAQRRVR